jgi:phosphoribosylformylglycinamidine cyclo-ligase
MATTPETTYQSVGVDTHTEELGLHLLTAQIKKTWPKQGAFGSVKLDIGAFANVLDIGGGMGLAISADGVGSKVLIAQMMEKYDTVGIDCVAMNVNDIICVGARPLSMVDYIAIEEAHPKVLSEIAKGLTEGAQKACISIPGGEIAQLPDVFRKHERGVAFDIAGMAVGTVQLDRILVGRDMRPGDVVIGLASSGIHSNGVTMARQVLFGDGLTIHSTPSELHGRSVGEELLTPTYIYVQEAVELLKEGVPIRAFAHITSDGFLNLPRVAPPGLGFQLTSLLPEPPIFSLIRERGKVNDQQMFVVYNMGVGFCIVVAPEGAEAVIATGERHGKRAQIIGRVIEDRDQAVYITQKHLKGIDKEFHHH